MGVLRRVVEDTPRPMQEIWPEIPDWLVTIVTRLHAKRPDDRFQSAKEVAELLSRCQSELQLTGEVRCVPTSQKLESQMNGLPPQSPVSDVPVAAPATRSTEHAHSPARHVSESQRSLGAVWLVATAVTGMAVLVGLLANPFGRSTRPGKSGISQIQPERSTPDPQPVSWQGWPADAPIPAIAPFNAGQAKQHQEFWAAYLRIPVEYTNSIGMKFRLIPPGEFTMGSTTEEIEQALVDGGNTERWTEAIRSEAPRHSVIITQPIYIGMHEVTQAHYEKVIGKNPSYFSPSSAGQEAVAGMDTSSHPVECVSWFDATEFCAKLNQLDKHFFVREGETITSLDGTGYRLPSEAEWEFACRAGMTTRYWTGNEDKELVQAAWVSMNGGGRTHSVSQMQANPFGLYDVHGNVYEWVQDGWEATYYGQFQGKPAINPGGSFAAGSRRVLRGGSWLRPASFCRTSYRGANYLTDRIYDVGFRVSMTVDAVKAATAQPALPAK